MTRQMQWLYGWLLVLPAASLLALFTHYPAIATAWQTTRIVISRVAYFWLAFGLTANVMTPANSTPSVATMARPSITGRMVSIILI
jgi:hypothetical protein